MAKTKNKSKITEVETSKDLKKQTVDKNEVKKGYNESNPIQPQGAFKPDNKSK